MLTLQEISLFALTALVLVLTPGPNMIYCVSRSLSQGRRAGLLSLAGVLLGFVAHLLAATLGLTALLTAVPLAFDALRIGGAAYLLWLAWDAVRPGGSAPFAPRALPIDSAFLARSRGWLRAQRYLMGTVLGALAARMAWMDSK